MRVGLTKLFSSLVLLGLWSCAGQGDPSPGSTAGGSGVGGASGGRGGDSGSGGAGNGIGGGAGAGATNLGGAGGAAGTAGAVSGAGATGGSDPAGGTGNGTSGGAGGSVSGGDAGSGSATGGTGRGGEGTGGAGGSAGEPPSCPDASTLREASSCSGRLIGAALTTAHLGEADYANSAKEFNYVTAENEMKWSETEATRDVFTFAAGDEIVEFAVANDMLVKGHTLVWYNQLPGWVNSISDASELRAAMVNHIEQVMTHYKGKVVAWDVVNEAWDPTDPTVLRDSVFTQVLGPSYIDDAFIAARAADPEAKLYYNDYGTDGLSVKANSVYEMVRGMKERGVPIDGVGLQMHWRSVGSTLTQSDVIENIRRLAALGVEVVISEMDVQLCKGGTLDDQQARFHTIVEACLSEPACTAVTFWGITDQYSWLNSLDLGCTSGETPRPLLWDDDYVKKSAYTGVMDALLYR